MPRTGLPDGIFSYQKSQLVCFHTKNPNLCIFSLDLEWKMLVYFMAIWNILRPFSIFYGQIIYLRQFGNFMVIWYIFPPFWYIAPRKIWQPWSRTRGRDNKRQSDFKILMAPAPEEERFQQMWLQVLFRRNVSGLMWPRSRFYELLSAVICRHNLRKGKIKNTKNCSHLKDLWNRRNLLMIFI
jgi:hypothetical protein